MDFYCPSCPLTSLKCNIGYLCTRIPQSTIVIVICSLCCRLKTLRSDIIKKKFDTINVIDHILKCNHLCDTLLSVTYSLYKDSSASLAQSHVVGHHNCTGLQVHSCSTSLTFLFWEIHQWIASCETSRVVKFLYRFLYQGVYQSRSRNYGAKPPTRCITITNTTLSSFRWIISSVILCLG